MTPCYDIVTINGDGIGPEVCQSTVTVLRAVARQRETLLVEQASWVQRMQKALVQMNIQLTEVLSDVMGQTGEAIARDIVAEVGDHHGLFQGAHGSAPDIAGQKLASPLATILSGAMMLRWLADRHGDAELHAAAERVERAVETLLAAGQVVPRDLGGQARCTEVTDAVCRAL